VNKENLMYTKLACVYVVELTGSPHYMQWLIVICTVSEKSLGQKGDLWSRLEFSHKQFYLVEYGEGPGKQQKTDCREMTGTLNSPKVRGSQSESVFQGLMIPVEGSTMIQALR
jgi:hypothetical protein